MEIKIGGKKIEVSKGIYDCFLDIGDDLKVTEAFFDIYNVSNSDKSELLCRLDNNLRETVKEVLIQLADAYHEHFEPRKTKRKTFRSPKPKPKEKKCKFCHETYPWTSEYFHWWNKEKDKLHVYCKSCKIDYVMAKKHGESFQKIERPMGVLKKKGWRNRHKKPFQISFQTVFLPKN